MLQVVGMVGDLVSVYDSADRTKELVAPSRLVEALALGVVIQGCRYSPHGVYVTIYGERKELHTQVWKTVPKRHFKKKKLIRYEVSNLGRVRDKYTKRELHPFWYGGCYAVLFKKDMVYANVAELVAETFSVKPKGVKSVTHIDGNAGNNSIYNLEWSYKPFRTDLNRLRVGPDDNRKVRQYTPAGILVAEYDSLSTVASSTGYNISHIHKCCKRKSTVSYNHIWRFADDDDVGVTKRSKRFKSYIQPEQTVKIWCSSLRGYGRPSYPDEGRVVRKYTLDGDFLAEYSSIDAIDTSVYDVSRIESCCNRITTVVDGCVWRYADDDEFDIVGIMEREIQESILGVVVKPKIDFPYEELPGEVWKPIGEPYAMYKDERPKYEVSNFARVRAICVVNGLPVYKLLDFAVRDNKVSYVNLVRADRSKIQPVPLHILVAGAFLPSQAGFRHVRHLDGNKLNNKAYNLSYDAKFGSKITRQYTLDGKFVMEYESAKVASEKTGISLDRIRGCCRREYLFEEAGGYLWRYAQDDELYNLSKKP